MSEFYFPATLTRGERTDSITAFNAESEFPIYQADSRHPAWEQILTGLRTGDSNVWGLFDVASGVMARFQQVTERVSYNGSEILWDGDPIHNVLAEQLERAIFDGDADNYSALAKFWEKLESNPNEHSRTQAFDWLACHKFQITPEGDIVGYKGTRQNGDVFSSTASSQVPGKPSAYVNGKAIAPLSVVPQKIGDTVTLPRSEVAHDPSQACKRGLHVATRSYASGFGTVLEVHVNPRDIVSVPTDGSGAKVRTCRYTVARVVTGNDDNDHDTPVLRESQNVWAGDVGYAVR